ncbi:MAG: HAD-IA family hydrolase [Desulfovibrionaceae bacterium]|nr:HAD-IA family hydrolase [Desulfovibrionaceae bacterium]
MFKHIFFDLDGTITDSQQGIFQAVRYALAPQGIELSDAALRSFIGPPLVESFQRECGQTVQEAQASVTQYREYYKAKGIFECSLYAGIAPLLASMHAAGKKIYLATSKPDIFAQQILEHFHLDHYFSFVAGAELQGARQSKEAVLRHLLTSCSLQPKECVLVGDRKHDVLGAAAVGLPCIGVLYGFGSKEELEQAGARWLCQDATALQDLLLT